MELLICFMLGLLFSGLLKLFLFRFRQAGRKGYGFEARGLERWKTALLLTLVYDLKLLGYDALDRVNRR